MPRRSSPMPRRAPVVSFVGPDGGWTACDALASWRETGWSCLRRVGSRTGIGTAHRLDRAQGIRAQVALGCRRKAGPAGYKSGPAPSAGVGPSGCSVHIAPINRGDSWG